MPTKTARCCTVKNKSRHEPKGTEFEKKIVARQEETQDLVLRAAESIGKVKNL
jgi:hypothetical protein